MIHGGFKKGYRRLVIWAARFETVLDYFQWEIDVCMSYLSRKIKNQHVKATTTVKIKKSIQPNEYRDPKSGRVCGFHIFTGRFCTVQKLHSIRPQPFRAQLRTKKIFECRASCTEATARDMHRSQDVWSLREAARGCFYVWVFHFFFKKWLRWIDGGTLPRFHIYLERPEGET